MTITGIICQNWDNSDIITLNNENIAAQKAEAFNECPLKGLTMMPKKTTKINNETLRFRAKVEFGIEFKDIKLIIESNNPIVKKEVFLTFFNNFSFNTPRHLSI